MVLELHVWGAAFGLPSIDPPCLAAIALFRQCFEPEEWVLIPAHDPSASVLGEVPALKHGKTWVAGYASIVKYCNNQLDEHSTIDRSLSPQQQADCAAYLAFIESRGLPLLDLALFVSSENYNSCTKPALGDLLTWPSSWALPGRLRARAKRRSEHLGLNGLDVDTVEDRQSKDPGLTAQIPASFRKSTQTVSSFLGRDLRKNKFRLDAVSSAFLGPLEQMLGQKEWLFGDMPSSADCLAVSLLALMYMPKDLPNPWLKSTINTNYPRLAKWIENQIAALSGDLEDPGLTVGEQRSFWVSLPWRQAGARSWQDVANAVVRTTTEAMPALGPRFAVRQLDVSTGDSYEKQQQQKMVSLRRHQYQHILYSQILISSLSLTTLVGVLLWKGVLGLSQRAPTQRFRNFGAAGNMLGLG